jgi:hypothetical protein
MLIQIRKYFGSLVMYGLFCLLIIPFSSSRSITEIYPALFPAATLGGYYLIHLKNREAAEIIHLALLGMVILFQVIF